MDPTSLGGVWRYIVALNEQTDLSRNQDSTSAVTRHFDLNISTLALRTGNASVGNIFDSPAATVDSPTLLKLEGGGLKRCNLPPQNATTAQAADLQLCCSYSHVCQLGQEQHIYCFKHTEITSLFGCTSCFRLVHLI